MSTSTGVARPSAGYDARMKNTRLAASLLLPLVAACHPATAPAPATTAGTAVTESATPTHGALAWMADDFPAALARAKAEHKPLFIDAWATWCHTCLSMQAYVFPDPALAPFAHRFVWLSLDTEKEGNAAATGRYPVKAYPTFFVVDPDDGAVAARWAGSMTVAELSTFLLDAENTVQRPGTDPDDPRTLMHRGLKAQLDGKFADAAGFYAAAAAKLDGSKRGDALGAQASALSSNKDFSGCVDLALAHPDDSTPMYSVQLVSTAKDCADELPETDPRREPLLKRTEALFTAVASDPRVAMSADDRSDYWRQVWAMRETLHDDAGARAAAEQRLAVLEPAAATAPDATAASTYDWARAETHLYLHHEAQAKALLAASEKALPDDYNPPARLAIVHFRLGEYPEALAAVDRALPKAYGERKGNILANKANILEKMGQRDAARAAVEEQLALYRALPEGQKQPQLEAAAAKRLAALDGKSSG